VFADYTSVMCYLTNTEKQNQPDLAKRFAEKQMMFIATPAQIVKREDGSGAADPFMTDPFEVDANDKNLFYRLVKTPAASAGADATLTPKGS